MARPEAGLLLALDLAGIFAFAVSGAMRATERSLDLGGVLVLALATGLAGGVLRDVLITARPQAIHDWRYPLIAIAAGLLVFGWHHHVARLDLPLLVLDAVGLALFAVSGAQKALAYGISPLMAILMGVVSGVGGGILRDMLVAEVPLVLRADVYATAALIGAGIAVGAHSVGISTTLPTIVGALVCFVVRLVAVRRGWRLPRTRAHQ